MIESIIAIVLGCIGVAVFTNQQDNDELGKEVFTPTEQKVNNSLSGASVVLGAAILIFAGFILVAGPA